MPNQNIILRQISAPGTQQLMKRSGEEPAPSQTEFSGQKKPMPALVNPIGKVILGGGWLATEYDSLSIDGLPDDALKGKAVKEVAVETTPADKEKQRKAERAAYKPITVDKLDDARTTVSLDGSWLFVPGYE